MVKIVLFFLLQLVIFANSFESNCKKCHNDTELRIFMAKYTLQYSSQKNIKKALYQFLKYPTSSIPLMPYHFIRQKGYKPESTLNDNELKNAIDIYYQKFNLKHFIK
ncbi:hypothetical protein MNB_SM-3-960 [hydrothermal vent metagenome]|uniref:Cytochrome c domain-containing protein n=1 Tax=hydrothermal vent metagenome TaxID=652676 RepID=A0A1W1D477_9ZZZZ